MARHHLVQVKAPLTIKIDIVGRVDDEAGRAENRAHQLALSHQQTVRNRQGRLVAADGADNYRGAADPGAFEGLPRGLDAANRFEGVVDAAVGQVRELP